MNFNGLSDNGHSHTSTRYTWITMRNNNFMYEINRQFFYWKIFWIFWMFSFFIRDDLRKQIFTNKFMDSRSYWRFLIENKIHRNGRNIVDKTTSITNKNEFLTKSIRLFWLTFLHCSLQHTNQQHTLATRYWNIRMFVTTNDPT